MFAKEKLYLTSDRETLVREGDPKAAFLYAAKGDEIPQSAVDKFDLVDGGLRKTGKTRSAETLLGSNVLPAMVEISAGKSVQLGRVVARAQTASGLSVADWNGLPEDKREALLAETVEVWKAEAASQPATKPARTRKTKAAKEQKPAGDKEQKPAQDKDGTGDQKGA